MNGADTIECTCGAGPFPTITAFILHTRAMRNAGQNDWSRWRQK